ncbi:MAG: alpha-2-macroglobulin family protein, partial [Limisphaerales bacterium]
MHHRRLLLLALALNVFAVLGPVPRAAPAPAGSSRGVQLVARSETLEPSTTLELRFDEPMVSPEVLGQPVTPSPLVFRPPLKGRFVWLSQRSGVFTPEEPYRLGTTYRLSLRRDLRQVDGRPLRAVLDESLPVPSFGVAMEPTGSFPHTNLHALPWLRLEFNASVDAEVAARFIRFEGAAGAIVAAHVKPATPALIGEWRREHWRSPEPNRTWLERFKSLENPEAGQPSTPGEDAWSNVLLVQPVLPLPAGEGWRLVVRRGLPSTEGAWKLATSSLLNLGAVRPFELTSIQNDNTLSTGKRLTLSFSKALAPELDATNLADWIRVEPVPAALRYDLESSTVHLTGAFQLTNEYTVSVRDGFPSRHGFKLSPSVVHQVHFEPLPPRLYFSATSTEQRASGNRTFPLLRVNTPDAVVRAKLIEPANLIHALRGYGSYQRTWEDPGPPEERFREVPYNLVPGRTVFERRFPFASIPDVPGTLTLNWDEVLAGRRHGTVFLQAESTDRRDWRPSRVGTQALVQLTDLGLALKATPRELVALAFSYATGMPVPGASVRLLTEENELLAEATTDPTGVARLSRLKRSPGASTNSSPSPSLAVEADETDDEWVAVAAGEDLRATRLSATPIIEWPAFGGDSALQPVDVLLFTDRPVYRPGETVQLKGIAREWKDQAWALVGDRTVRVVASNARGRAFLTNQVVLGDLSSFDTAFVLPASGLGTHSLEVQLATQTFRHALEVQEFKPNAFLVSLEPQPEYAPGELLEIPIGAQYLFGQKLSHAQVQWTLTASDETFQPAGFDAFQFGSEVWTPELGFQKGQFTTAGKVDLSTQAVIHLEIPINPAAPHPRRSELTAEVTDLNQQTVTRRAAFTRHSSDFYLGMRSLPYTLAAGFELPIEVIAVSAAGIPHPDPVSVQLSLQRIEWETVRFLSAGGSLAYRSEPRLHPVRDETVNALPVARLGRVWIVPPDAVRPLWTAPQPGQYLLVARSRDAANREVVTALTFHATGREALAWNYRNAVAAELVPDQPLYQPGQTAAVLVKTPIGGSALITVEREKVLRSWTTNLAAGAPVVHVPLEPQDAPNVFVSVLVLRGSADSPRQHPEPEYRVGTCELKVEQPGAHLAVQVTTSAPEYRPQTEVTAAARVLDSVDLPVRDAEVTLFAVDEGVLSLMDYQAPDPFAFFHRSRRLEVMTRLTLPSLHPESPEELGFHNKGYLIGDGGKGSHVRRDFLALAFWNATMRTDADGKIDARFAAPDSLTRYRVFAIVHTASSQFGHGETAFAVNQPLMLEPAPPRFANVGDRIQVRAVAFNRTTEPGEVEVRLRLDDRAKPEDRSVGTNLVRTVPVPAQGAANVDFPLEFVEAGTARWRWDIRFVGSEQLADRDFTDAVESTLEVGYPVSQLREVHVGRVSAGSTNLLRAVNPQILEGHGQATVRIANTRLGELGTAASQLVAYPYGCVEQTTSRLLALLVLREQPGFLRGAVTNQPQLEAMIRSGLAQLLSMQNSEGGLGYWPGSRAPTLWGSAYGSLALTLARREGLTIDEPAYERLLGFLFGQLPGTSQVTEPHAVEERCLALYALAYADRPQASYHDVLLARMPDLSTQARAWLALAVATSADPSNLAV